MANVVQMQIPAPLPDGIDSDTWEEFKAFRSEDIKKPLTERAERMMLKRLCKIRDAGYCPNDAMEQSMINGWQNVFPSDGVEAKSKKKETWKLSDSELIEKAKQHRIGASGKSRDQLIREIDGHD